MKIVGPPNQKLGVVATSNPFKKVMNGVNKPGPKLPPALPKPPAPIKGAVAPKAQPVVAGGVKPLLLTQAVKPAPVSKLDEARAQAHAKAAQLVEQRGQGFEQAHQRYDTRLVDLICQELKIEFGAETRVQQSAANSDRPVVPQQQPQQQLASVTPISAARQEAEVKAASAMQLIEKIETFVKSSRPALALTLDGSLGARVEIERLGPKEVAIRMVGSNGPPKPEDVGRIRDEMRARGLRVAALSVA